MGTNYYLASSPPCKECGHQESSRHIGKSSAGWVFALHVYPDEGIEDLDDWRKLIAEGHEIRDEYGIVISADDMISTITERSHPKGLRRSRPDSYHCLKNGDGTWDCHVGDFS